MKKIEITNIQSDALAKQEATMIITLGLSVIGLVVLKVAEAVMEEVIDIPVVDIPES